MVFMEPTTERQFGMEDVFEGTVVSGWWENYKTYEHLDPNTNDKGNPWSKQRWYESRQTDWPAG